MSDDIVKELRESKIALHSTAHKAADEIDKLREELEAYDKTIKEHCDETTSLRAELAVVTAERDRMREALIQIKALWWNDEDSSSSAFDAAYIIVRDALEGVTNKGGEGNE